MLGRLQQITLRSLEYRYRGRQLWWLWTEMDYVAAEHYYAFERKKALPNQPKVCWELPEEQLTWSWSIVESLVVCSHIVHFGPEPSQTVFLDTYIPDFVRSFARVFKVVLGFLATYLANCHSIFLDNMLFFASVTLVICRRALPLALDMPLILPHDTWKCLDIHI